MPGRGSLWLKRRPHLKGDPVVFPVAGEQVFEPAVMPDPCRYVRANPSRDFQDGAVILNEVPVEDRLMGVTPWCYVGEGELLQVL